MFNTKSNESDITGTQRIKIVRDVFTDENGNKINMSYDQSASGTNLGNGINQWGEIKDSNGNITY